MSDEKLSEALHNIKSSIRMALAMTAQHTGLRADNKMSEHLIDTIVSQLFESQSRWAVKSYLDELQYDELISFAHSVATDKKPPEDGGVPA